MFCPTARRHGASLLTEGLLVLALGIPGVSSAELVNGVVLRVNSRMATLHDYELRRKEYVEQILASDLPSVEQSRLLGQLGQQVLKELYEELLLLSRGDQLKVRVTEAEIDQAMAQAKERMGIENEQDFVLALAKSGLSRDDLHRRMEQNLVMQEVLGREVHAKIELDEDEMRRYWRDHPDEFREPTRIRLEEIVVLPRYLESGEVDQAELGARVAQIEGQLLAGASLADVADAGSASGSTTGLIDLGWLAREDLDPELAREVWDLSEGELSAPVRGRGGIHLMQVKERRESFVRPFAEVQDEVRARHRQHEYRERFGKFLKELEERAYIVVNPPPEAEGFLTAADLEGVDEGLRALERPSEAESEEAEAPQPGEEAEAPKTDEEPEAPQPDEEAEAPKTEEP